jgi:uncharacterized membrane protein YfcA
MSAVLTPTVLAVVVVVALVAGAVNGVAGFGFALVGTMVLASVIDPATAVVFMILPILSVNLSLVRDLSPAELRTCVRRFGPLLTGALVGTLAGLVAVSSLPASPLKVGLGAVTLAFVLATQRLVPFALPELSESSEFGESLPVMVAVGGVGGLLFGGTNVGVQLIAYLRSRDVSHATFVGVVAMVFLGLNGLRAVAAGALGLYPSLAVAAASVAAAVPAVAGVAVGKRLRSRIGERERRGAVLGLLTLIGIRLILGGLGIA